MRLSSQECGMFFWDTVYSTHQAIKTHHNNGVHNNLNKQVSKQADCYAKLNIHYKEMNILTTYHKHCNDARCVSVK